MPGGPAVKTLHFDCRGQAFDPWLGSYDPTRWGKNKNKKLIKSCYSPTSLLLFAKVEEMLLAVIFTNNL